MRMRRTTTATRLQFFPPPATSSAANSGGGRRNDRAPDGFAVAGFIFPLLGLGDVGGAEPRSNDAKAAKLRVSVQIF
jgi:hypothetical protein